jgi:hypothetical protein
MDKMSYIFRLHFHPKDVKYQITEELGDPRTELENGARKKDSGEWRSQQLWVGGWGEGRGTGSRVSLSARVVIGEEFLGEWKM